MLMNFDTDVDQGVTHVAVADRVTIKEEIRVGQPDEHARTHLVTTDDEVWTWEELRDYVVEGIESRFGAIPRLGVKESGIFKSFLARWEGQAVAIARYAVEIADCRWRGAPISVTRFCKNSDPTFAAVIAKRLEPAEK